MTSAGLPVGAPLADERGQTFQTIDRRPVTVFPWIEGEHRPGSVLTVAEALEDAAHIDSSPSSTRQ